VAVIAHPWGRGSRRVIDSESMAVFAAAGLVGLEVDHQDHSPDDRRQLAGLAADSGLVVTGSSDYHGDGKLDHELGCNVTAPAQLEALLAAAAESARVSGRNVARVVNA
jgi:predicted metal-dependent phosphoesterase TrpH